MKKIIRLSSISISEFAFRRLFFIELALIGFLSILPALVVLWVDPFHVYRKPVFSGHGFNSEEVFFHVPGMINHYFNNDPDYQAVIVGASRAASIDQRMIDQSVKLGKTLNLAVNGSYAPHHEVIARKALETGKVRYLFWSIHMSMFLEDMGDDFEGDAMPIYLYNDSVLDDVPYLFNGRRLLQSIRIALGVDHEFIWKIDDVNNWAIQRASAIKKLLSLRHAEETAIADFSLSDARFQVSLPDEQARASLMYPAADNRLLKVIEPLCNGPIDVMINFPPKNMDLFIRQDVQDYFQRWMQFHRYLVEKLQHCNNVAVYAHEHLFDPVEARGEFIDSVHFTRAMHERMLQNIASGQARLTLSNIQQYEREVLDRFRRYQAHLASLPTAP